MLPDERSRQGFQRPFPGLGGKARMLAVGISIEPCEHRTHSSYRPYVSLRSPSSMCTLTNSSLNNRCGMYDFLIRFTLSDRDTYSQA